MNDAKKELKKLMRIARKQGCKVKTCGSGHLKWYLPKGIVHTPKTPSEYRSILNVKALLRKHGLRGI